MDRLAKIDCTVNGWPCWGAGMPQPVGDGAGLDDQLEQWRQRLAKERGEEPPQPDEALAKVRNALEPLDDAGFADRPIGADDGAHRFQ